MNTIEGNKLIAEFDGWVIDVNIKDKPYWHPERNMTMYTYPESFKYNTSWDWQIPVWSKIIMLIYERGLTPATQFKFKYFVEKYDLAVMENKPEDGQRVIVEAIKWYNTTKS